MRNILLVFLVLLFVQQGNSQGLDRSQKPNPGKARPIPFADPVTFKLSNGMTVMVMENHKLPKVSVDLSIDAGPRFEGSKAGLISLMGNMLMEGTNSKTKVAFDKAVDQLGAKVTVSAGGGSASVQTRHFEQAFYLMSEALRKPAFPEASFEKLKSQAILSIESNSRNSKMISSRVVNALLFGKTHALGEFETKESIQSITLDDVWEAYRSCLSPSRSYLTFVGDIKPKDAKAMAIKAFGDWQGKTLQLPVLSEVTNPPGVRINVVDLPGTVQSEITVARVISLPLSSPDYFAVLLANQLLGGGGDAKLFRNLREQHGFTYGANSNVSGGRFQTIFSANAAVRNEKVDSAVVEFLKEIRTMEAQRIKPEELQEAKNLYNGSFALNMENPALMSSFARNILINDLPKDFYRTYLKKLNAVTTDDVLRVSKKYFDSKNISVTIVGKKQVFFEGLKSLNYNIQCFDIYATLL